MNPREEDADSLRWAAQQYFQQIRSGDFFFLENPLKSRLWEQEAVAKLRNHPDVIFGKFDGGAYGAADLDGHHQDL